MATYTYVGNGYFRNKRGLNELVLVLRLHRNTLELGTKSQNWLPKLIPVAQMCPVYSTVGEYGYKEGTESMILSLHIESMILSVHNESMIFAAPRTLRLMQKCYWNNTKSSLNSTGATQESVEIFVTPEVFE